eukprot:sb/3469107/
MKQGKVKEYVNTQTGAIPLEIYISMSLDHKNIVRACGFLKSKGSWCLVMEHLPGYIDLTSYIQLNSYLSHHTSRTIFIQTYRALTYCFRRGIAHRDIKTDNLLVHWETNDVKLIDFGASTFIRSDQSQIRDHRGTDIFIPPEFFTTGTYDPLRGTVWALGCLLYCMVYGEVPFLNPDEVVYKILDDMAIPSPSREPGAHYCMDLIDRCLEKREEERITYREISHHPWITRNYPALPEIV